MTPSASPAPVGPEVPLRLVSNELQALLDRVASSDPGTAKELRKHVEVLQSRRQYGLNFERHTPESVALVGRPLLVGDKARFLPERGQTEVESSTTWVVTGITGPKKARVASLLDPRTKEEVSRAVEDLIYIAEFRDPIYPGLVSTGRVERGGDKPYSMVINGENYHALEAMLFTNRGKVDCIYIDPPYNTRANDWKYNNDYVDPGDSYAHSKWLAFMERRLKVARELLNPEDSVLIVTIDEKEYLRLGLLLEQLFPEARIQMVSSVINPGGASRVAAFTRVDEYVFFVKFGDATPAKYSNDMLFTDGYEPDANRSPIWRGMLRGGSGPLRADSPSKFYPVLVDRKTGVVVGAGEALPLDVDRTTYTPPAGLDAVWPLKRGGIEGRWELNTSTFEFRRSRGYVRAGDPNKRTGARSIYYLRNAEMERLESGELISKGMNERGFLNIEYNPERARTLPAKTVWNRESHNATEHGSNLLKAILPGRKFPFPKSLYAVEDALRFFIGDKPDALVVDFFSGSGTTAHAVMRLNRQDGGCRRSISVTNNEVNDEEEALLKRGLRAGDPEWDCLGICERITKPRIAAAVTGQTPEGVPIKGEYRFTDEFPMADGFEENVEFFTLTYENPELVELDLAFGKISPLLWMRAGAQGRIITERNGMFDLAERYAVLFSVDAAKPFLSAVADASGLRVAYIVTDDEMQYQAIAGQLPDGVESVRLYESYLRTFEINTGRV